MPTRPAPRPTRPDRQPRIVWPDRGEQVVFADDAGHVQRLAPTAIRPYRLRETARHGAGRDLLIHGENYHALRALLDDGAAGTVDLVYIDPPFNTGRRFEHYGDRLDDSVWLQLLRSRLQLLHALLSDRGSIVVHIDERVAHLTRLLLDEVHGPVNYRNTIIVKRICKNLQRQFDQVQGLPMAHDVCLLYSKLPSHRYPLPLLPKADGPRHPQGYWKDFWSTADRPTMRYELLGVTPTHGQWKWRRSRAEAAVANYQRFLAAGSGELVDWWREHGETLEFIKLTDRGKVSHWVPPSHTRCADTIWDDVSAYAFRQSFPTEKNEALLRRFIELFSAPGDLVLDCFAGSGTTGAAAAALDRRWILIERGDQAETHIIPRLRSAAPEGFRVCDLMPSQNP